MNVKSPSSQTNEKAMVLLKGCIENYRASTQRVNFFEALAERKKMAAASAAAALAGMGGLAVGTALMASDDLKEDADRVEFDLNGQHVEGYLWLSPFKNGDEVEVVAERLVDGNFFVYGMCRPSDKIIALSPHCTRGRIAHYWMSFRFLIRFYSAMWVFAVVLCLILFYLNNFDDLIGLLDIFFWGGLGGLALFFLISVRVARKYLGFVEITEKVLSKLGWSDPSRADLPKIQKRNARPDDTSNHGTCFFRYDDSVFGPAGAGAQPSK